MKQLKLSDLKTTEISNVCFNGIHYDKFYEYIKPYYVITTYILHKRNDGAYCFENDLFIISKGNIGNLQYLIPGPKDKHICYCKTVVGGNSKIFIPTNHIEFITDDLNLAKKYLLLR